MARIQCLVLFACLVLNFGVNAQYYDEKPNVPFAEGSAPAGNGYLPPQPAASKPSNAYLPAEGSESNPEAGYLPPPEEDGSPSGPDGVVLAPPRDEQPAPLNTAPVKVNPQLGCAAALLCVEEQYCTMTGMISETPIRLTEAQLLRRVPMVDCRNPENGVVGKCCRDPNYEDPWPNGGNLPPNYKGGFDNNGFPLIFNYNYTSTARPITPRPNQVRQPDVTLQINKPLFPQQQAQPNFPRPSALPRPAVPVPSFQRPVSPQPGFPKPVFPQPNVPNFIGLGSNVNAAEEYPSYNEEKDTTGQELLSANQGAPADIYKVPGAAQQPKPFQSQNYPSNVQVIQPEYPGYESSDNSIPPTKFSPQPNFPTQTEQPSYPSPTPTIPVQTQSPFQFSSPTVNIQSPTQRPFYASSSAPSIVTETQQPFYPSSPLPTVSQTQQPAFDIGEGYDYAPPVIQPHTPGAQCGLINKVQSTYNLNGAEVPFGAIPWQAMILSVSEKKLLCSGAIVAPNAVLTTASCVYGRRDNDISVKAGEWKLGYELKHEEPLPFEIVQVQRMEIHPNYRPNAAGYDMAVLLLEKPFKFDLHVDSICLGQNAKMLTPQKKCIATGWGKKIVEEHLAGAHLNKIQVSLLDDNECRNRLQGAQTLLDLNESLMCTKATYQNNNLCQVDAGGPLACDRGDGYYEIIGVYSQDTGCSPVNQVATFAMIDYPWIHSVLGGPGQYQSRPIPNPFLYEGPTPYVGSPSNQPRPFQTTNQIHYHQPGVPCDCREGSVPAGLNRYLPPQ